MTDKAYNFLIAGVGGQGTVLASDILAEVGIRLGYDTKKSDILGLAVRGGAVVSHIQWALKVHSPVIDEHDVDYMIGFEWLETLRRISYIKPDGMILVNDYRIDPMTVSSGQAEYPNKEFILDQLQHASGMVKTIPGTQTALDLGNVKTFNIVVLGGLCRIIDLDPEIFRSVVKDRVPPKVIELNLTAFNNGYDLMG